MTAGWGSLVRQARKDRGWSQTELATRADVSRPTIARIESGQHVLMGTLEKVAGALELDLTLAPQQMDESHQ